MYNSKTSYDAVGYRGHNWRDSEAEFLGSSNLPFEFAFFDGVNDLSVLHGTIFSVVVKTL